MRRWLAIVILLLMLPLVLAMNTVSPCPPNPLATLEQGRWTVQEECVTVSGQVVADMPSSNGAYWVIVQTTIAPFLWWTKIYPDKWPAKRPSINDWITVTGPFVKDGAFSQMRLAEIVPVVHLQSDGLREYNEQRADGWWHVWKLVDGSYRERYIPTWGYKAAGIT